LHHNLAYYFDHREAIDRELEKSQAFVEALRQQTPSLFREKVIDYRWDDRED
jgi:hypothetical protein